MIKFKDVYKYTLKNEHKYVFTKKYARMVLREQKLVDGKGFHCATIYPSKYKELAHIIIQAGYSWDGNSPKVQITIVIRQNCIFLPWLVALLRLTAELNQARMN